MENYFKKSVQVVVVDLECEFTIPLELAVNLKQGDSLWPIEKGVKPKWVLSSHNLDKINDDCIIVTERFYHSDSMMILTTIA